MVANPDRSLEMQDPAPELGVDSFAGFLFPFQNFLLLLGCQVPKVG